MGGLSALNSHTAYIQGIFDDVGGEAESVDLLDGRLKFFGGAAIGIILKDGVDGGAQALGVEFAAGHDDAGSAGGDAGGDSGLVVADGDADQRNAFGERLERGVDAGMGDDDGCPLDEFQLGRVFDDDGIAAEDAETFAVEAGAERDDELHGKIGTGGGNDAEDVFRTVLEGRCCGSTNGPV